MDDLKLLYQNQCRGNEIYENPVSTDGIACLQSMRWGAVFSTRNLRCGHCNKNVSTCTIFNSA